MFWKQEKLDWSFLEGQVIGPSYRVHQCYHGGGKMLFVKEDVSSKQLLAENKPAEGF